MKKLFLLFMTTGMIFVLNTCKTDFDTIAPYKDISVVYCLLDQRDSITYLKLNKAFLGEGNALVYASVEDSSNYPYPLNAWLEQWSANGDSLGVLFHFDTTTIYNKEPGTFYNPEQVIYKGGPDHYAYIRYIIQPPYDTVGYQKIWLDENSIYKLKIEDPVTGKMISAQTSLVENFKITRPFPGSTTIKFVTNPSGPTTFAWTKAPNDTENKFRYDLQIVFNYRERVQSGDTINKFLMLASGIVYPSPGNAEISYYYYDNNFFASCLNNIPYKDAAEEATVVQRYTKNIEVIVSAANADYNLYMQVYEPSTSIAQEKPTFTNIDNGIGIFSSRYQISATKRLHAETVQDLKNMQENILKILY